MNNIIFPTIYPVASHTDNVGPGTTFVAIKGYSQDGIYFIESAINKGATQVVVQKDAELNHDILDVIENKKVKLIRVDNAREALADLSAQAYNYPAEKLKIIGITGTKGKSTTSFLLEHILRESGHKTALLTTVKNRILDSEFKSPLTTAQPDYLNTFLDLCVKNNVEYVVMEVAAQALTLNRIKHVKFVCALWTNFSLEHSEFYSSMDDYFNAKVLIFDYLKLEGAALLNKDDQRVYDLKPSLEKKVKVLSYGLTKSDFYGQINKEKKDYLEGKIIINNNINGDINISAPNLIGTFNFYNILAAASCAKYLGISNDDIEKAVSNFNGVPGRLQKIELPNGSIGIIDYAHNPSSIEEVLKTLRDLTDNLIVLFGAGGDRDKTKRPIMGQIAGNLADFIILTTDNPRSEEPEDIIDQIKSGIEAQDLKKVYIILDRQEAIEKAYELSKNNSIIALLGKGPDEYQIIKDKKIPFSESQILRSFKNHEIIK